MVERLFILIIEDIFFIGILNIFKIDKNTVCLMFENIWILL